VPLRTATLVGEQVAEEAALVSLGVDVERSGVACLPPGTEDESVIRRENIDHQPKISG
jgi:hypothetical protein